MSKIVRGRLTHHHDGERVVFHIGRQINRWWRPDLWLPAFFAMPRMLRELSMDDDSGLLGFQTMLGSGGPYVTQYWSPIDKLYAHASTPEISSTLRASRRLSPSFRCASPTRR